MERGGDGNLHNHFRSRKTLKNCGEKRFRRQWGIIYLEALGYES
jgi:hypothetical protein